MKLIKEKKILLYKLLEIIIFLMLSVWAIALFTENIIPGIISTHLSFLKITVLTSLLIIILSILGKNLNLSFDKITMNKLSIVLISIFSFVIISLSLIKFNWLSIIIISITSLFIIFYFLKIFFEED